MLTIIELLLIAGALFLIGYPIFFKKGDDLSIISNVDDKKTELIHRKEYAYLALRELEDDYRGGKISEEDYKELKKRHETEAIHILKELDGKSSAVSKKPSGSEKKKIFCAQCGNKIQVEDKFCTNCGKKTEA